MGDFRKPETWRRPRKLTVTIYRLTTKFPTAERYGLTAQMRRAAVSVAANLAEGCGRMGDVELRRFVRIGLGSLAELECELLLASDLKFVEPNACTEIAGEICEIRRMLQSLHDALPNKRGDTHSPTRPRL